MAYEKPRILTLDSDSILESIGPASALASGMEQGGDLLVPRGLGAGSKDMQRD